MRLFNAGLKSSRNRPVIVNRPMPGGLSLLEVLIVMGIIGTLIAMLLPAIGSARASARKLECANKLRQLGIANMNFESARGHFPGYSNREVLRSNDNIGLSSSWMSALLPYIEEKRFAELEFDLTILAVALCPDDRINIAPPHLNYPTSYVANAGIPDIRGISRAIRPDVKANGLFHQIYVVQDGGKRRDFDRTYLRIDGAYLSRRDGASRTLLLSENVDALNFRFPEEYWACFLWTADQSILKINEQRGRRPGGKYESPDMDSGDFSYGRYNLQYNRPSSYHQGNGVNAVFCDGHVKFLSDTIEYAVYAQLMTPDGSRSVMDVRKGILAPTEFREPLPSDY